MEGFQSSFMEEVDNMTWDQLGFQSEEDTFNMSELLSPPPEVPVNPSFISCNDQGGQYNVINDSIQQTTPFPTSFPETMPGHGYMTPNATTSQHGGFNQPGPSFPPPWYQPNPNLFDPQCANPMLPGPSMPLRDQQWTNYYQLPIMSNQVPAMNQWHQYSNIHQPQPRHGYMTPNATTSQHGGFIQPGPSFPAPRSQYFSNQGQVDQAAVIPNIDNLQQENFVPRSQMDNLQVRGLQNQTATPNALNPGLGTSLQSQNSGLNTQQVEMIRSKDPFWNYIEDRTDGSSMKCKFCPHTFANKTSISRIKWHLSREEGHNVAICRGVTKEVQEAAWKATCGGNKRHKSTASSVNVNDCGISTMVGGIGRVQREVQVVEPEVGEQRISSHAIAGNDVVSMTGTRAREDRVSKGALESRRRTEPVDRALEQNTGEGSFRHDAFETVPRTEQEQLLEPRGDASQFCLDSGICYDQPCAPSVNKDVNRHDAQDMVRVRTQPVENSGRSVVQAGPGARSSESKKYNKTRGVPLPTSSKNLVGRAFEDNTKVTWYFLMDDELYYCGITKCPFPSKTVGLGNLSINRDRDFQVKFLNYIRRLVCQCIDVRSLCDVLSLENAPELEVIQIWDCNSMESLVSSSWFCYAPPPFPSYNGMFSGLKEFYCGACKSMKNLFPLVLLPNLEVIVVRDCEKMEEIVGTTDEESSTSNSITEFILPKLRTLELSELPELKSFCSAKLTWNSLEEITVINCQKLKRMAFPSLENGQQSPLLSLNEINARQIEWWETLVEGEHL